MSDSVRAVSQSVVTCILPVVVMQITQQDTFASINHLISRKNLVNKVSDFRVSQQQQQQQRKLPKRKTLPEMYTNKAESIHIKAVPNSELPPEFKLFDKPFGMEQHHVNFLFSGVLTHACCLYYIFYLFPFGYVPRFSLVMGELNLKKVKFR